MQVPLYFLNKEEVKQVNFAINIHQHISTENNYLVDENKQKEIIKKLNKREFLENKNLLDTCSIMVMVIVSAETIKNTYDIDINEMKHILLKLISSHFDRISDDEFVDNRGLFIYVYNIISKSFKSLTLNKNEEYAFNFLKLLQI